MEVLMPQSVETILARLDALEDNTTSSIDRVARAVEIQNGRITTIEMQRAREEGARDAVATAAAQTAAALQVANNVREKSRTWKATVIVTAMAAVGGVVTVGSLVAHALINYHP